MRRGKFIWEKVIKIFEVRVNVFWWYDVRRKSILFQWCALVRRMESFRLLYSFLIVRGLSFEVFPLNGWFYGKNYNHKMYQIIFCLFYKPNLIGTSLYKMNKSLVKCLTIENCSQLNRIFFSQSIRQYSKNIKRPRIILFHLIKIGIFVQERRISMQAETNIFNWWFLVIDYSVAITGWVLLGSS